jgi:hypothetical protein
MYLNRGKQKAAEPRKQHVNMKRSLAIDTNDEWRWSSRTTRGDVDKEVRSWYRRS